MDIMQCCPRGTSPPDWKDTIGGTSPSPCLCLSLCQRNMYQEKEFVKNGGHLLPQISKLAMT